jgi:hypothetical protein
MASRLTKEKRPRNPVPNPTSEWEIHPPLPPREIDPSGEGDALKTRAHPGDDTVFAANTSPAEEQDAERSRTKQ